MPSGERCRRRICIVTNVIGEDILPGDMLFFIFNFLKINILLPFLPPARTEVRYNNQQTLCVRQLWVQRLIMITACSCDSHHVQLPSVAEQLKLHSSTLNVHLIGSSAHDNGCMGRTQTHRQYTRVAGQKWKEWVFPHWCLPFTMQRLASGGARVVFYEIEIKKGTSGFNSKNPLQSIFSGS